MDKKKKINIALVGKPNNGKSTIFNFLTDGKVSTGNYQGVTVERAGGYIKAKGFSFEKDFLKNFYLMDLPGIQNFPPISLDENIACQEINSKNTDVIVMIIDATKIETQLDLFFFIKKLNKPLYLIVNMMDMAKRDGIKINQEQLKKDLEVDIIFSHANRSDGQKALLTGLERILKSIYKNQSLLNKNKKKDIKTYKEINLNSFLEPDFVAILAKVKVVCKKNIIIPRKKLGEERIDRIFLHPFWGWVIFAFLLFMVFQAVFTLAVYPTNFLILLLNKFSQLYPQNIFPDMVNSFVNNVLISGIGSILVLVPQIFLLLFAIYILEASGYMARTAFLMDGLMRRIGLSGSSFVPLMSGFACAVPAIMTTRHLTNHRDRLLSMVLIPLIPCTARLPVYVLLVSAIIPARQIMGMQMQGLVIFILYSLGILVTMITGYIISKFQKSTEQIEQFFAMPRYQKINIKMMIKNLTNRIVSFLYRIFTIILITTFFMWLIIQFPLDANDFTETIGGKLGYYLHFILAPIGFSIEMSTALVPGLAAREVAISSLATIYSVDGNNANVLLSEIISTQWTFPMALSFLCWYIIAPQCISTIGIMKKESNSWIFVASVIFGLFILAYAMSFLTFNISSILLS